MGILEVSKLVKNFGGLTAVNNLSFSIEKGGILGIVGPNGSGKTTAFNLITGFIKPDHGQIFLNGNDITGIRPHQIVRMGMARTFQLVRVFRHLSVYDNIKAALLSKYSADERKLENKIREYLTLVGLDGKISEEAVNLPIGDLKKLEICRALATEPNLILLDEPFSGLTNFEVNQIAGILSDLMKGGMTIIIVEHVLRALRKLVENILVLDFGNKIAEGKFDEVITRKVVRDAYLGGTSA